MGAVLFKDEASVSLRAHRVASTSVVCLSFYLDELVSELYISCKYPNELDCFIFTLQAAVSDLLLRKDFSQCCCDTNISVH